MTQIEEEKTKAEEFSDLFLALDEIGKEAALAILRSLSFAQNAAHLTRHAEQPRNPTKSSSE